MLLQKWSQRSTVSALWYSHTVRDIIVSEVGMVFCVGFKEIDQGDNLMTIFLFTSRSYIISHQTYYYLLLALSYIPPWDQGGLRLTQ